MEGLHDACIGLFVTSRSPDQPVSARLRSRRAHRARPQGVLLRRPALRRFSLLAYRSQRRLRVGRRRPDERMPADNYVVRWTGQIEAPSTETFQFAFQSRGPARLYVNKVLIASTGSRPQRPGTIKLVANQRYEGDDRVFQNAGPGFCKLMWASETQPGLAIVPNDALTPDVNPAPPPPDPAHQMRTPPAARGVLLGRWDLPARLTEDGGWQVGHALLSRRRRPADPARARRAARLRPLSTESIARIPPQGSGVLTIAGDFAEGEPRSLANGKLNVSTVVFGEKVFDVTTEAGAAVYRPVDLAGSLAHPHGHWCGHSSELIHVEGADVVIDERCWGSSPCGWMR